jgi:hypothetical protein
VFDGAPSYWQVCFMMRVYSAYAVELLEHVLPTLVYDTYHFALMHARTAELGVDFYSTLVFGDLTAVDARSFMAHELASSHNLSICDEDWKQVYEVL